MGLDPARLPRQSRQCLSRRLGYSGARRIRRHHAVALAAHAIAANDGPGPRPPSAGMLRTLQDQNPGPLSQHGALSSSIERPAHGIARVAGPQDPSGLEAGQYLRMKRAFRSARDHQIELAGADLLYPFGYGIGRRDAAE